jgi:branched-chain amino acid transport system ATP-binding protein
MLICSELAKRYGGVRAVESVSMSIEQPGIYALIGANGSGKTTLFNLLSGFVRADHGEVRWQGRKITRTRAVRRAQLGLVRTFQQTMSFPGLTVWENLDLVGLDRGIKTERLEEIAELCRITEFATAAARDIPFGVARRLGIGLALVAEPTLLLLDEPAAGLNDRETDELAALLRDIHAAGTSVFVIEHNMDFVMPLSDEIFVMDAGSIMARGTPEEIASNEDVIRSYLGEPQ